MNCLERDLIILDKHVKEVFTPRNIELTSVTCIGLTLVIVRNSIVPK